MATTPTAALRYPTSTFVPNIPQDVQNLATDLDQKVVVPVATQAARDALTKYVGLEVARQDSGGRHERWNGSRWTRVSTSDSTIGSDYLTAQVIVGGTVAWTDYAVVTGTSTGGLCEARILISAWNGSSGADRTIDIQVVCDGTATGSFGGITIPIANLKTVVKAAIWSSTPSAGTHTWRLQLRASATPAVQLEAATLTVVETT